MSTLLEGYIAIRPPLEWSLLFKEAANVAYMVMCTIRGAAALWPPALGRQSRLWDSAGVRTELAEEQRDAPVRLSSSHRLRQTSNISLGSPNVSLAVLRLPSDGSVVVCNVFGNATGC